MPDMQKASFRWSLNREGSGQKLNAAGGATGGPWKTGVPKDLVRAPIILVPLLALSSLCLCWVRSTANPGLLVG